MTETTALGAAYLAGLAVGFWQSQAEIADLCVLQTKDKIFTPTLPSGLAALRMQGWLEAVEHSKGSA